MKVFYAVLCVVVILLLSVDVMQDREITRLRRELEATQESCSRVVLQSRVASNQATEIREEQDWLIRVIARNILNGRLELARRKKP